MPTYNLAMELNLEQELNVRLKVEVLTGIAKGIIDDIKGLFGGSEDN